MSRTEWKTGSGNGSHHVPGVIPHAGWGGLFGSRQVKLPNRGRIWIEAEVDWRIPPGQDTTLLFSFDLPKGV